MTTRREYVTYLTSLRGAYGPGKGLRNNDNAFNTWYYGRRVSGNDYAWCEVIEKYAQNRFGILAANGGKSAYVPEMANIGRSVGAKVWHRPTSVPKEGTEWAKEGNLLVFAFTPGSSGSHTGTYIKRLSSTLVKTFEGNTESDLGSDVADFKQRSVSNILYVIELLGVDDGTTSQEDDVPKPVSLGISKPVTMKVTPADAKSTVWNTLEFDKEYDDKGKQHGDGRFPSVLTGPAMFALKQGLVFTGIPKGVEMQVRAIEVDAETNAYVSSYDLDEFLGSNGDTYKVYNLAAAYVDKGHKVRVQVGLFAETGLDTSKASLKIAPLRLHYWAA